MSASRLILAGAVLALSTLSLRAEPLPGQETFEAVCAACHGEQGQGVPGIAPPLADPPLWQMLGDRAPEFISGVMISGFSGALFSQGQGYFGLVMPSQRDLSDAELTAVAGYVLGTIAATDQQVDESDIAAARATPPSHGALMALRKGGS